MKANTRRMIALLKMIDINWFYTVSINRSGNTLQGEFKPALIQLLLSAKFKSTGYSASGYAEFVRNNFVITLT